VGGVKRVVPLALPGFSSCGPYTVGWGEQPILNKVEKTERRQIEEWAELMGYLDD